MQKKLVGGNKNDRSRPNVSRSTRRTGEGESVFDSKWLEGCGEQLIKTICNFGFNKISRLLFLLFSNERKNEGRLRRGSARLLASVPPFFFSLSRLPVFSLVPNYREPVTDYSHLCTFSYEPYLEYGLFWKVHVQRADFTSLLPWF